MTQSTELRRGDVVGAHPDTARGRARGRVGLMCVVTLTLMIFLLPAGIADGILSGTALVLILAA